MRERAFRTVLSRSLKAAREERGLTQRSLAEKAAIGFKYLSRIELARATPSVFVVRKLAIALGTTLDELVATPLGGTSQSVVSIARLLSGHSESELDRARRVLVELLR